MVKDEENETFTINMWFEGQPRTFKIDEYLPYNNQQINSKMLWLNFLEKAMAKVYGNYEKLSSGSAGEVYP